MTATAKTIIISNHSDILLQDVLLGVSTLETNDLEHFMLEVGQLLAARKTQPLTKKETILLKSINNCVPLEYLERYQILVDKSVDETMTLLENEEYLELHEKIQALNAKRFKKIVSLARSRNVSVPVIMQQFNLFTNELS